MVNIWWYDTYRDRGHDTMYRDVLRYCKQDNIEIFLQKLKIKLSMFYVFYMFNLERIMWFQIMWMNASKPPNTQTEWDFKVE